MPHKHSPNWGEFLVIRLENLPPAEMTQSNKIIIERICRQQVDMELGTHLHLCDLSLWINVLI